VRPLCYPIAAKTATNFVRFKKRTISCSSKSYDVNAGLIQHREQRICAGVVDGSKLVLVLELHNRKSLREQEQVCCNHKTLLLLEQKSQLERPLLAPKSQLGQPSLAPK
jgi:hypothetical protein